jgi:hypothetical protein
VTHAQFSEALTSIATLAAGVASMAQDTRSTRQLQVHETPHDTPWNPDTRGIKLKKWAQVYQNGARVDLARVTPRDLELFDQLRAGKYNHKKWTVRKTQDGGVSIDFDNRTLAQRTDTVRQCRDLTGMLEMIVLEQEEQAARKRATGSRFADEDDDE